MTWESPLRALLEDIERLQGELEAIGLDVEVKVTITIVVALPEVGP